MAAIGEDSSGQDMKKNTRWERIEDAEGTRSRADLNRDRITVRSAVRARLGPLWLCASLFTCPCCDEQDLHCRGCQKCSGAAG